MSATSSLPPVAFVPCIQILQYLDWYLSVNNPAQTYENLEDILEDIKTNTSLQAVQTRPFFDLYQLWIDGSPNDSYQITTNQMPMVVCVADNTFVSPSQKKTLDSSLHPTPVTCQIVDAAEETKNSEGAMHQKRPPHVLDRYRSTPSIPKVLSGFHRLKAFPPLRNLELEDPEGVSGDLRPPKLPLQLVAPRPEPSARSEEEEEKEAWTYGPDFSSNCAIEFATGIIVPKPWFQLRPPPVHTSIPVFVNTPKIISQGESVPLSIDSPFKYPGGQAGDLAFLQSAAGDEEDDDTFPTSGWGRDSMLAV
ncbi:hypothetical protein C8R44DRAFT_730159 [Mycena epipterygia]|nr:hypothetical protein C8R44DRAFT_730159 [Mycena epipterygia]